MSQNIVLTFSLLLGSFIALICAVYSFLIYKRKMERRNNEYQKLKIEPEQEQQIEQQS